MHGKTLGPRVVWMPLGIGAFVQWTVCRPCGPEQAPQWLAEGEHLEALRMETLPGERGEEHRGAGARR